MAHHTLEAVMSMPTELFYPVGTVTCVMVWKAHIPHATTNRKTWFGYWRDDGFVKTKHRGRIDLYGRWPAIRDNWVETYREGEEHPSKSIKAKVGPTDEWVAEAYLVTDYSEITPEGFEKAVKDYAVFRLLGAQAEDTDIVDATIEEILEDEE